VRLNPLFLLLISLSGCISFNSTGHPDTPDYVTACEGKESQCREICGAAGIQTFY
jgi:hypothetical protein